MKFKITSNDWNKIKDILRRKKYQNKKYEIIICDLLDEEKTLEFTLKGEYTNISKFLISDKTEIEVIDLIEELDK